MNSDTICAIATVPGGAIGIVRISGSNTFPILRRLCPRISANTPPRTAIFTTILPRVSVPERDSVPPLDQVTEPEAPPTGKLPPLDEALVTLFPAPHSYTGEDCAELSCHGSRFILNQLLDLLIRQGARLANPGEFTMRAYLNGKLDLSQAEAVADLIAATNEASHHLAMSQLRGGISTELSQLRNQLLHLTSLLELELDFSDHEELEFADRSELQAIAKDIDARVTRLACSFETGQALKQGIPVAIIGKTNVGKSTLLNHLLHEERAIVSEIHGTTRDTIEDTIDIHGITFRFIDTAGIRQTNDAIEQIGIRRTYEAIDKARIVIWLLDGAPTEDEVADITLRCEGRTLIPVWNKIDLLTTESSVHFAPRTSHSSPLSSHNSPLTSHLIRISAKYNQGLDILEQAIYDAANIPDLNEQDLIVSSARQYQSLVRAHESITQVLTGLETGLSGELIAEELKLVLDNLADITGQGRIVTEEVLETVFSHFCVGK